MILLNLYYIKNNIIYVVAYSKIPRGKNNSYREKNLRVFNEFFTKIHSKMVCKSHWVGLYLFAKIRLGFMSY